MGIVLWQQHHLQYMMRASINNNNSKHGEKTDIFVDISHPLEHFEHNNVVDRFTLKIFYTCIYIYRSSK